MKAWANGKICERMVCSAQLKKIRWPNEAMKTETALTSCPVPASIVQYQSLQSKFRRVIPFRSRRFILRLGRSLSHLLVGCDL